EEETPPPLLNVIKLLKDVLEEIKQGKSEGKLLKFYGDYKNAKQNIYDNVNHIDLDKNFNIIFTILNEDTNYSIIEKFLELLA
ncbi:hypothetical protein PUW95_03480, partial [Metamycoplasma hyosynoviae]